MHTGTNVQSFSSKPKPATLADELIAAIQACRKEINRMEHGEIKIVIQHYRGVHLCLSPRYSIANLLEGLDTN